MSKKAANQGDQGLLSCLSEKEVKNRRNFKRYIVFDFIFTSICSVVFYWNNTGLQLFYILFGLLVFYLLYHCAYKKHGTVLVSLQMIIGVPWSIIKTVNEMKHDSHDMFTVIGILILLLFSALFIYFGVKIVKINKKIQKYAFILSDHYRQAIDLMNSAKTLPELTFKFHEAFRECPGHICHLLSPIYEDTPCATFFPFVPGPVPVPEPSFRVPLRGGS